MPKLEGEEHNWSVLIFLYDFESFKKDDDDLMDEQFTELENCIWNSLLAKEHAHSARQIHPLLRPPPEYPLKFSVENLVVEQVDTVCLNTNICISHIYSYPAQVWSLTFLATYY